MTYNPNSFIWARAAGESLQAIKALWVETETKYTARELFGFLRLLGLETGVVQVTSHPIGKHHASEVVNLIYKDPIRRAFYIRVPVNYKGVVSIPAGAVPLEKDETSRIMDRLFSGRSGYAEPLAIAGIAQSDIPVPVPGDYKPAAPVSVQSDKPIKPFEP